MIRMKKGFTLVELLAVIIIISVLTLIAIPKLISSYKSYNNTTVKNLSLEIIYNAVDLYVSERNIIEDSCVDIQTLIDEKKLSSSVKYNDKIYDNGSVIIKYNNDTNKYTFVLNDDNNKKCSN